MKWFRIIFCYPTVKRFEKLFKKLDRQGYRLYVKGSTQDEDDRRKMRNYIKNINRAEELLAKFMGK